MPEPDLSEIMRMLTRIETTLETVAKNAADHESRLRKLEGHSGARWDALASSLLSALLVGAIGYFIGKL